MVAARNLAHLGLLFLTGLCVANARAQEFAVPGSARTTIIEETNAYRGARGLAPLRESAAGNQAAQRYARYLAINNKTGHRADGRSPAERLRAAGVRYCKFRGENWHLSWTRPKRATTDTAMAKAMRFWKRSPGHERALRSASTEIGVGVAGAKHGTQWHYVSVQMFFDTSCFRAPPEKPLPPLPHRNPMRPDTP
jgi:uncharacterized protein YkwD